MLCPPRALCVTTTLFAAALVAIDHGAAAELETLPAPLAAEAAFENLKVNRPVAWLVRLVAYDPRDADEVARKSLPHLERLGSPSQAFTFVADYAELRGCTAADAFRKLGGTVDEHTRISAIIFRLDQRQLYPANVRGVLQVIEKLDEANKDAPGYLPAKLAQRFADRGQGTAYRNLDDVTISSWAWDKYAEYFPAFRAVFRELHHERAKISAFQRIGTIGPDWCEFGYSKVKGHGELLPRKPIVLDVAGRPEEVRAFGARAFLIENLAIDHIAGRMLVDFDKPQRECIPYVKTESLCDAPASVSAPSGPR